MPVLIKVLSISNANILIFLILFYLLCMLNIVVSLLYWNDMKEILKTGAI